MTCSYCEFRLKWRNKNLNIDFETVRMYNKVMFETGFQNKTYKERKSRKAYNPQTGRMMGL